MVDICSKYDIPLAYREALVTSVCYYLGLSHRYLNYQQLNSMNDLVFDWKCFVAAAVARLLEK